MFSSLAKLNCMPINIEGKFKGSCCHELPWISQPVATSPPPPYTQLFFKQGVCTRGLHSVKSFATSAKYPKLSRKWTSENFKNSSTFPYRTFSSTGVRNPCLFLVQFRPSKFPDFRLSSFAKYRKFLANAAP